MENHIQELLNRHYYSEELKQNAVHRILFEGETTESVMKELRVGSIYTITNWISSYKRKIQQGLITLPPMSEKQQNDLAALKQRNKELEKAIKEANLKILALNTMIDYAEKRLNIPIRKKPGTKQS